MGSRRQFVSANQRSELAQLRQHRELGLVDEHAGTDDRRSGSFEERTRSSKLAACLEPVVDNQYARARGQQADLKAERTAVALVVAFDILVQNASWEVSGGLTDRDEADPERRRCGPAEQEAARLDSSDMGDAVFPKGLYKRENAATEQVSIGEEAPNICVAVDPRDAGT
jgi:hypothetical protein